MDDGLVTPPQARRPPGVLRQDGRGVRRGPARGAGPLERPSRPPAARRRPSRDRNDPCAVDAAHGIREDPGHGAFHLDRRDQLRAGHGAREALPRGEPEDRPLPPAQREHRRRASPSGASTPPPARRCPTTRSSRATRSPRRSTSWSPGGARGARPQEDEDDRHRGLRRARRDRPDLLRPPVLPGARAPAGPSPTACCWRRCARRGSVAIAKVVIRQKESLVAIRAMDGDVLGMATMIFADEVVDPVDIDDLEADDETTPTTASWRSPSSSSSRWPASASPRSTTTPTARRSCR